MGDELGCFGSQFAEGLVDRRDLYLLATQIVNIMAKVIGFLLSTTEEALGNIVGVLHILPAAEADMPGFADGDALESLGRFAGHAEVTPDAIDGGRANANTIDAILFEVDAGIAF